MTVDEVIAAPFVHRGHAHARGDLAVHLAQHGIIGAAINAHNHPAPVAVPESLLRNPYHFGHSGQHASNSLSHGPILVPHGPRGKIALEESEYTGYNPGPLYVVL
jgi:hypothetical protein